MARAACDRPASRETELDQAQSRRYGPRRRLADGQHGCERVGRHRQRPQRDTHDHKLDVSAFPARIGGEVVGFNAEEYMSPKDIRKFDPFVPFGFAAAVQAVKDSGIEVTEENSPRIGVAIGAGIGGLSTIEENTEKWLDARSPRKISPFFIPGSIINAAAGQVSIHYGMRGSNLALVTACTTSTHSIGIGARIQYGDADVMIAGGAEMAFTPLGLGSFGQAKALSLRNDEPERAGSALGP